MPKDEFDFEDPLELNGRVLLTQEDTTDAMCECFIGEFMRMGFSAARILSLFRNPQYIGMHLVWQQRGELLVRNTITELFARWGRTVTWPAEPVAAPLEEARVPADAKLASAPQSIVMDDHDIDPMGSPLPKINL